MGALGTRLNAPRRCFPSQSEAGRGQRTRWCSRQRGAGSRRSAGSSRARRWLWRRAVEVASCAFVLMMARGADGRVRVGGGRADGLSILTLFSSFFPFLQCSQLRPLSKFTSNSFSFFTCLGCTRPPPVRVCHNPNRSTCVQLFRFLAALHFRSFAVLESLLIVYYAHN